MSQVLLTHKQNVSWPRIRYAAKSFSMDLFKLHFVGHEEPSLFQTEFVCGSTRCSAVRGKTSGAFAGDGSFHWSIAVRALAVLAIKTSMAARGSACEPILVGEKGSLAASLDYAISKETHWLVDVFGLSDGRAPNFKRVFKRTNSGRKRIGPVAISLSRQLMQPGAIIIRLNSIDVVSVSELEVLLSRVGSVEECGSPVRSG